MNWRQAYDRLESLVEHGGYVQPSVLNQAREYAEREQISELFGQAYVEVGGDVAEMWANGELG